MIGRIFKVIDAIQTFFENWTLFIAVMAGLFSLLANVVMRYGFNHSLAWSEELIREIIIYTTFIGCSAAVKNRNMIVIDALPQTVPKLKMPLVFLNHASVLLFSILITYLGWQMAALQLATHQKTILMEIPLVYLYAVLPMMGVMMFFRVLHVMHKDLTVYLDAKKMKRAAG